MGKNKVVTMVLVNRSGGKHVVTMILVKIGGGKHVVASMGGKHGKHVVIVLNPFV